MELKHSHTELAVWAGCPACSVGQYLENPKAPPGCTYVFEDNPIDGMYVCQRHGTASAVNNEFEIFRACPSGTPREEVASKIAEFYASYTGSCILQARMNREKNGAEATPG